MIFDDPVVEQFRLNSDENGYSGTFTLAYPTKKSCVALGFTNQKRLMPSQFKALLAHVKEKGRERLVLYRERDGKEIEKVFHV